jgi:hypothetical protein
LALRGRQRLSQLPHNIGPAHPVRLELVRRQSPMGQDQLGVGAPLEQLDGNDGGLLAPEPEPMLPPVNPPLHQSRPLQDPDPAAGRGWEP